MNKKTISAVTIGLFLITMFIFSIFSDSSNGLFINIHNQMNKPIEKVCIYLYNSSRTITLLETNELKSAEIINDIVNIEKYKGSEYALTADIVISHKKYEASLCPYLASLGGKHKISINIHNTDKSIIDVYYSNDAMNQENTQRIVIK